MIKNGPQFVGSRKHRQVLATMRLRSLLMDNCLMDNCHRAMALDVNETDA
jgi:hypothetical protein